MVIRKKNWIIIGAMSFLALGIGLAPQQASSKIVTNVASDVSGEEVQAIVVEDFEAATIGGDTGYNILSEPKQFTNADTEQKLKMKNPVPMLEMKQVNGSPNDMAVEEWSLTNLGKKKEKCLGVRFKFRYPGTENSIHIIPPKELDWKTKKPVLRYNPSTGKDEQENALQLPGKVRGISLWVHGRGKPYTLEVWVKDYKGDTHVYNFGSINFVGWRPLKVYIPTNVPQETDSYPAIRVTRITRFVVRVVPSAEPESQTEDTYVFLDQVKALTDMFEVNFDGQELDNAFEGGSSSSTTTKPAAGSN